MVSVVGVLVVYLSVVSSVRAFFLHSMAMGALLLRRIP